MSADLESSAPEGARSARAFAGDVQGAAASPGHRHPAVPPAIVKRYLKVDDRYLFPDRTVAFVDKGSRIRVRTENREVIHSVVAIAQQRGWQSVKVRGSRAFRQAIWKEAALQGINVKGYTPADAEREQAARAQVRQEHGAQQTRDTLRPPTSREAGGGRVSSDRTQNAGEGGQSTARSARRADRTDAGTGAPASAPTPIVGKLVAAAAAPYRFDPAERMSYYVKVETDRGERTVWGADLERALVESVSQPRPGATVVLTQQGAQAIEVRVPARNEAGDRIGDKKIVAQRARWSIETSERMRELQQAAEIVRAGTPAPKAALDSNPSLATAAAGVKLAQAYAARITADPTSQQRLVDAIRERLATAVQQGQAIHLPVKPERDSQDRTPQKQRSGRNREERLHERH